MITLCLVIANSSEDNRCPRSRTDSRSLTPNLGRIIASYLILSPGDPQELTGMGGKLVRERWCCCGLGYSAERTTMRIVMVCMIQGLLWSSLSVLLLAVQTCALQFESTNSTNIRESKTKFMYIVNLIFVAYLNSSNCSRQSSEVVVSYATTERTYNLLLIHGFLNAVWIPISVLLIVGVLNRMRGCLAVTLIYIPWLLVTFTVVVFDLVAASYYVSDMDHAGTLNSFLAFLRFSTSTDRIIPSHFIWDSATVYAPLVFIFFFSRCVLLSAFNVAAFLHVFILMIRLCRERRFAPISGLLLDSYDEIYHPIINSEAEHIPLQAFMPPRALLNGKSNRYEPELDYYNSMLISKSDSRIRNAYQNREPSVHTYLDLLNYQTPVYQHIYEDIWRDVKKERLSYASKAGGITPTPITPVSPVYDYLGRPVREPPCHDVDSKASSRSPPYQAEHHLTSRKSSIPFVRSNVPPALPPCNSKTTDHHSKIQETASEGNESLTPDYEQAKFSCEPAETPFEIIPEDSVQDIYNNVRRGHAEIKNLCFEDTSWNSGVIKRPSAIKKQSLDDYDDSAYNSGSSISNFPEGIRRQSCENCHENACGSGNCVANCSRGVQTCSDYACVERDKNATDAVKVKNGAVYSMCSDSGNESINSVYNSIDSNNDHSNADSAQCSGTCIQLSDRPEHLDLSKLPNPHNEQRKNKRNLSPLIIKPLPPKIQITPSNKDQKEKARM